MVRNSKQLKEFMHNIILTFQLPQLIVFCYGKTRRVTVSNINNNNNNNNNND